MNQWFKCRILGENFPDTLIGEEGPVGFYTTRAVLAESVQQAESTALDLLRLDPGLQLPDGTPTAPQVRVFFEDIWQVAAEEGAALANTGFTWFPMETTDAVP